MAEFRFRERRFDSENLHYLVTETFVIIVRVISIHRICKSIVDSIYRFHADSFAEEGMVATEVNYFTLHIHHVVVFEQAFTDSEVVLFYLLLGALNRFRNHRVLNHLTLLETEAVHHFGNSFRAEETHKVVFEGDVEYGRTRVSLTSGTTA